MTGKDSENADELPLKLAMRVQLVFPDGDFEDIDVTQLGPDSYRLEETPVFTEWVGRFDVFEAERSGEGRLRFLRIVEHSPFEMHSYVLSREIVETGEFESFIEAVVRDGGRWERMMGSILTLYLPKTSALNPREVIQAIQDKLAAGKPV